MKNPIRLGTRASNLAMTQAKLVQSAFEKLGHQVEIVPITTTGDKDQRDFHEILGDGFFTRSIERALLLKEIDLAIHSAKDLPSLQHNNLPWMAFSHREDAQDLMIARRGVEIKVVGTSSPRRQKQIITYLKNVRCQPLRGNVETRLQKLRDGNYDAIILAKAGVLRLNLIDKLKAEFDLSDMPFVSAPTQGILALQTRREDIDLLTAVANKELSQTAFIEKEVLKFLGGGCHLAIGVNASTKSFDFYRDETRYHFNNEKNNYLQRVAEVVSENSQPAKVILTHSIQQHEKVSRLFAKENIGCYSYPLIEIKTIFSEEDWQDNLTEYDLIFTSPNAASIFFQEAFARNIDIKQWQNKKIYCVGEATAKAVRRLGLNVEPLATQATSKELIKSIDSNHTLYCGNPNGEFVKHYDGKVLALYSSFSYADTWQKPPPEATHMVFCSPSSVEFALKKLGKSFLQERNVYSFGPTTALTLQKHKISYIENPIAGSWQEMLQLIKHNM